jgi:hypothetical protein
MTMNKKNHFLMFVVVGLSIVFLSSCKSERKNTEEPKLFANVNLNLRSTSYGELKRLLLDPGQSDRRAGESPLYKNAVRIEWNCGVTGQFLRTSEFPGDADRPISLSVRGGVFKGSICGIHLGDSVETALRECGCSTTDQYETSGVSHIYADCRDRQSAEIIASHGKIDSIDLGDKEYRIWMAPKY